MNQFGNLKLGFKYPVYVAPNITILGNGTISQSDLMNSRSIYGRALQLKDEELPILELNLIPGPESNAT
jgi:hypothetical protein